MPYSYHINFNDVLWHATLFTKQAQWCYCPSSIQYSYINVIATRFRYWTINILDLNIASDVTLCSHIILKYDPPKRNHNINCTQWLRTIICADVYTFKHDVKSLQQNQS